MDKDYPCKDYPYTDKSTLYICHGCKRAISIRTKKIYFRDFMKYDPNIGKTEFYSEPFCETCNKNPDTWWNY